MSTWLLVLGLVVFGPLIFFLKLIGFIVGTILVCLQDGFRSAYQVRDLIKARLLRGARRD